MADPSPLPNARCFEESERLLARALQTIPLGTQTFSKSVTQYPRGAAPFYIARAKGSRCWDVDGNEYIDFVNALCAVSLGHNDPDVNRAVAAQMEDGVLFSLPHPVEIEVAERIRDIVPCAEMVRFGKNGSDATAGAVRIARAFTGRDRIACCGYHGWQDWFIGTTTRNIGVPSATSALTHAFPYNDLKALAALFAAHPGGIAAVIMEPMNVAEPEPGYLEGVKEMAHAHGALLIFDEMITGFRYANGGAQAVFGVTPDLACFGKALANGYPLSAIVGRGDVMRMMEDAFFSFTMGGETLSLAAAKAALDKVVGQPVTDTLAARGRVVMDGLAQRIARHGVSEFASVAGHPSWSFLMLSPAGGYTTYQIKTLLLQEMFARGVLALGTHNMSYAHGDDDIAWLLDAYDEVLPILRDAVAGGTLQAQLRCEELHPLFTLRSG
jgi:glutamate-1-semialdehyde 2,1-aminomutase